MNNYTRLLYCGGTSFANNVGQTASFVILSSHDIVDEDFNILGYEAAFIGDLLLMF